MLKHEDERENKKSEPDPKAPETEKDLSDEQLAAVAAGRSAMKRDSGLEREFSPGRK